MSESDSDESVDQLEKFRNANIRPGMFVSGWEDPNDEVFPDKNPRGWFKQYFIQVSLIFLRNHCQFIISLDCRDIEERNIVGCSRRKI